MNNLFKGKRIFLVIGALLIFGAGFYLGQEKAQVDKDVPLEECQDVPELPDRTSKLVTKIIDGDTFLIEGGYSVRILGIDADERDHPCYEEAKNRLEKLILNKKVELEKGNGDKDQWCRYLRYVFLDDEDIGLKLVEEGLAIARTSLETTKYREEIITAESHARESKVGCKWRSK